MFQAVAKEGSITKAAASLGYVQSNVTARIQQLEAELETKLFFRNRGMFLTGAGERLLSYSEQILQLLNEAKRALSDTDEPSGRLALGASPTVATAEVPKILVSYHHSYPNVELSLATEPTDQLVDKVRQFQLDLAFVKTSEVTDPNIVKELRFEERLVLIAPPNVREVRDVIKMPFLMNSSGCAYRKVLDKLLASMGTYNERIMEFNHVDTIIGGVIAGLGVSLVPETSMKQFESLGHLKSFEIPPEFSRIETYLIRHKDSLMTSSIRRFIEVVERDTSYHRVSASLPETTY